MGIYMLIYRVNCKEIEVAIFDKIVANIVGYNAFICVEAGKTVFIKLKKKKDFLNVHIFLVL